MEAHVTHITTNTAKIIITGLETQYTFLFLNESEIDFLIGTLEEAKKMMEVLRK